MSDNFHSPDSLLASLFSQKENHSGLFLLTGNLGIGKTTWCLSLVSQVKSRGIEVNGVISPPVYVEGRKAAIDLVEISTGERRRLAVDHHLLAAESPILVENPGTEAWQFDPTVMAWGNKVLQHTIDSELFILDELGPLEFLQGQGFQMGLRRLDMRRDRLAIAVVRPWLLTMAIDRWPWAQVAEINPITENAKI